MNKTKSYAGETTTSENDASRKEKSNEDRSRFSGTTVAPESEHSSSFEKLDESQSGKKSSKMDDSEDGEEESLKPSSSKTEELSGRGGEIKDSGNESSGSKSASNDKKEDRDDRDKHPSFDWISGKIFLSLSVKLDA